MANDLATLSSKLATALRDTSHETWTSTEKDDLVTWAVDNLYPKFARVLDPETTTVALVTDTYFYDLPAGVIEVSTVELYTGTDEYGPLDDQAWQVVGDPYNGTGKLRISPIIADTDYTVRLHGYGVYDTTTNLIPDTLVPLVLAKARVEAYRRLGADRANFLQWQTNEQTQNISVNELLQLMQSAQADVILLEQGAQRTWRRPVPGRLA